MQWQCVDFYHDTTLPNMHLGTTRRVVNAREFNSGCWYLGK